MLKIFYSRVGLELSTRDLSEPGVSVVLSLLLSADGMRVGKQLIL